MAPPVALIVNEPVPEIAPLNTEESGPFTTKLELPTVEKVWIRLLPDVVTVPPVAMALVPAYRTMTTPDPPEAFVAPCEPPPPPPNPSVPDVPRLSPPPPPPPDPPEPCVPQFQQVDPPPPPP